MLSGYLQPDVDAVDFNCDWTRIEVDRDRDSEKQDLGFEELEGRRELEDPL